MTVTVTIQDGAVPDGFEPVRYGWLRCGENYLFNCEVFTAASDHIPLTDAAFLIIRPIYQPPSFLKPGWIAMDKNGDWYWYSVEPTQGNVAWNRCYSDYTSMTRFNWTPPPCTDWTQSLTEIKAAQ